MNKRELIKHIEDLPYNEGLIVDTIKISRNGLLKLIEQLDEPEKVKIPQFVAEWIEVAKTVYSLTGGMTYGGPGVNKWLENEDNQRTFALAWFDGYEVKEKRYLVTIKGIVSNFMVLKHNINEDTWYMSNKINYTDLKAYHTMKELEDAGFGWVFDCEGIEVEEVTE